MDYPADGTPFELDNRTVDLLYNAVTRNASLTEEQRREALRAVDYISAAELVVHPDEDEEDPPVPKYDDNDTENPYPRDREDGEGLGLTRPSYGD